ncbi:beta-galactosidase trimerization domain-containing protein, partial [Streptomyces sp. NPDC056730]
LWSGQDGWGWAEREDVVSVDIYPDPRDPHGGQYNAMLGDLTRSQARGPWMLMEQAAGAVNWRGVNHPKPAGLNRLLSWQSVARGADAVCYFQWRQSRQGAEKFHSGMLSHAGEQGRTFREIKQIGAELELLGPEVTGTHTADEIALLHDWDSWWADQQDGRLSARLDYPEVLRAWHRALWESNLRTGFARPGHDLSPYRLVVVPHMYLLADAAIDDLVRYVRDGGTLVSGFLTGVADEDDRVRAGGMDVRLRELFGIGTVHEWWPLDADETVECDGFRATLWSEELEVSTGETVASYTSGELAGLPAVLRNGRAWYVSTLPEPEALRALLAGVARSAGVRPVLEGLPEGVEAVRRGTLLFLLNHGAKDVTVAVDGRHRELLSGRAVDGSVGLGRHGVAILRARTP